MKPTGVIQRTAAAFGLAALVGTSLASTDYAPADWAQAYSGHWYTTGYGHKFTVVHTCEGYYYGTISYLRQAGTSASAHYVLNSDYNSDGAGPGDLTQMIRESYYAWHAVCWNRYSFGNEHEGFVSNPAWYTEAMYQSSADLNRHLCDVWGIAKDRNHIVGHNAKSSAAWCTYAEANFGIDAHCNTHTDPGGYWDWSHYMDLVNPAPAPSRGTPPCVIVEPSGALIVFAIHTGGSVQYREQSGASQPFRAWNSLAGSGFTNVKAVRSNSRFYVFGSGNGGPAYWNYQPQPAGAFSGWGNLGGTFDKVKPVALPDGRLAMFATTASSPISYQVQSAVGYTWPGWSSLGGSGFNVIDGFALSDGRLGVVGTGRGNAYVKFETSPGTWTGFINVGGTGITYVRAVVLSDDRVALFGNNGGYGNPGTCYYQVQSTVNGAFPGWTSVGGSGFTEISPCRYADNRLAFFGTSASSSVYYQVQSSPGGAWSGWQNGCGGSGFGGIDATVFATDELIVFGHGGNGGELLYNYQNSGNWAGWTSLGGSLIF